MTGDSQTISRMTTLTAWTLGTIFAFSSLAIAQESFPAAPPVSQAPVMGNEGQAPTATPSAPKRSKKHKKHGKKAAKKALKHKRQRTQ